MRLHRLQVNAFGPFAGAEEVDFDLLAGAGLFLLHGPTGAGKSSVLDAVCYALYGRLPGARGTGRPHLRSDHAGPSARPEVRLELTLDGRRFLVTRTPEWHRPKKRGAGTTVEKGSVMLQERVAGRWEPLSSRADEVGEKLQDLIGMRLDQFTKVVLLPQGEFAAFLRADAESRRSLLEQLFATRRFSDVESWLSERRRTLSREVAAVRSRTHELLARADEHAAALTGTDPADGSEADQVGANLTGADQTGADQIEADQTEADQVEDGPAARRLQRLADHAGRLAATAAGQAESATAAAEMAAAALTSGRDLAARIDRLALLSTRAEALVLAEPDQVQRRDRLALARRAAPLRAHLTTTARLEDELTRAATALDLARAAVPAALTTAGRQAVESAARDGQAELGRVAEGQELAAALAEQQEAQADAAAQATAATLSAQTAATQVEQAEQRRTAAMARLDQFKAAAAQRPVAEARVQELDRVRRALDAQSRLQAEVAIAQASVDDRRALALAAKEHWLELRERRLVGIAAELSAGLVDGAPCPVCGSAEHPAPAQGADHAVTEAAEAEAQQVAFDADQALASARDHLTSLSAGLADQRDRAGAHSIEGIKTEIAAAKAELAAIVDAADRVTPMRDEIEALAGQVTELTTLSQAHRADAVAQRATAKAAGAQARRLTTRLDKLRGADADMQARQHRIEREVAALAALMRAIDDHEHAVEAANAAMVECESAYTAAGFDDVLAAAQGLLPEPELSTLAAAVAAHDVQAAALQAQLQDPTLLAVIGQPAPDLEALAAAEMSAAARRRQAEQEHARVEAAHTALQRLAAELTDHEQRTGAVLAESVMIDDLARCVEGTGGDNLLRMRLSSYVLAARLEEVAAAATERLLVMSDGRYSLVHTDDLAKGGVRSGLGLRVVDGWTGVERDTGTLSGGESFLASLALALGLADAVQAEAGGAVMETLFIDEGFGMLDDETLDEVMTVLDSLREGGRSVGLVSHVADLRSRIPAQLEVRKSRGGSRILVQDAGAA